MVNAFLIIATVIISVVLLFVNLYILVIYIHPDDKGFGSSILAKILVIFGLTLAWGQILMMPLDVANSRGTGGGLDMDIFWKIVLIADAIMLIILIPFGTFRYEADEEASFMRRLCGAICYTVATVAVFALIIGISYAFLSKAEIPVVVYAATTSQFQFSATTVPFSSAIATSSSQTLEMPVSFPIYILAFFSLVGWFFFFFFGGLGLFAVPMDLINEFRFKPKKRTTRELNSAKQDLQNKVTELLDLGQTLKSSQESAAGTTGFFSKRRAESKVGRDRNKFKAAVLTFEKEFEVYTLEKNYNASNPLIYFLKLVLGLFLFCISILWWIQILIGSVIYVKGFPLSPFLNNMLIGLNEKSNVGFIATFIFGFLSIYLIWAVTKGNLKFGLRIPFLFKLHPMKPNDTLMNSFLFNVWILLISSIACLQFLSTTFAQYIRLTTIDSILGTQVKYMKFYQWFFKNRVFEIAFLVWSALGLLFVCCCREKPKELKKIEQLRREIAKGKK